MSMFPVVPTMRSAVFSLSRALAHQRKSSSRGPRSGRISVYRLDEIGFFLRPWPGRGHYPRINPLQ